MSTMTRLFAELDKERSTLLSAIHGLSDAVLDQKDVVGEWSIKNVLAHLTDWERVVTGFVPERLASGTRPEVLSVIGADEDGWNAQQVAARERLTPKEQLDELERTRQALFQVLRDVGEEKLNQQHPWPGWDGTLSAYILEGIGGHEREHSEAVLAAVEGLQGRDTSLNRLA